MNRITNSEKIEEDKKFESLRPESLDEYIGQDSIKRKLRIFIKAARQRDEALDHVLFHGPPGLGKTTLAVIIAAEMGVTLNTTSGPALERPGDIAAILTNIQRSGTLFIDEIHRLPRIVEEKLYPAMEDFQLDIVIGQGPAAKIIPLKLDKFTLIGATTRFGAVSSPMRDRFGVVCRLDFYPAEDIYLIIKRSAKILNLKIDDNGCMEIARRSRGTPRIANRLLRRVRDFAEVEGDGRITAKVADAALKMLEIDGKGLDSMDRKLLQIIHHNFAGGPVGLDTLAAAMSESRDTIEDVYEPFLIQIGFLEKTPRGRKATPAAAVHLGETVKTKKEGSLGL